MGLFLPRGNDLPLSDHWVRTHSRMQTWAAANGGVTNGGSRGVWLPFPGNRPFLVFVALKVSAFLALRLFLSVQGRGRGLVCIENPRRGVSQERGGG